MFFAKLTIFFIFVGGCYCLWRFIIKPTLEANGVECDDKPQLTTQELRGIQLVKDLSNAKRDAEAMKDIKGMTVEKAEADAVINSIEQELAEYNKDLTDED